MVLEQVIKMLQTNPEAWKVVFQNTDSIVFAWGNYRFTRLSDRFDCMMILSHKQNQVNFNWAADDSVISQIYWSLVAYHLQGFSTNL